LPEKDLVAPSWRTWRLVFIYRIAFGSSLHWRCPELLSRASLFVLSSKSEGIALTILEAQARGVPVIATEVGGIVRLSKMGNRRPRSSGDPRQWLRQFSGSVAMSACGNVSGTQPDHEWRSTSTSDKWFSVTNNCMIRSEVKPNPIAIRTAAPATTRFPDE